MSTKNSRSLNYTHDEINLLLNKIDKNKVLTEDQYNHLFVSIGLSKIDKALDKIKENENEIKILRDKHIAEKNYIDKDFDALNKAIDDLIEVDRSTKEILDDLYVDLSDLQEYILDVDEGIVAQMNTFMANVNEELKAYIDTLNELELQTSKLDNEKAAVEHTHVIADLLDIESKLSLFEYQLREKYLFTDLINKSHTHPDEIFSITKDRITEWDSKATVGQINSILNTIAEIKGEYETTEEIRLRMTLLEESINNCIGKYEELLEDLQNKAREKHVHNLKDIDTLVGVLDSKVDKERNKTLIDYKTLSQIKNLLAQQRLLQAGEDCVHANQEVLDSITQEDIDRWNSIEEDIIIDLIKEELKNSSLSDLINNDFYTREEVHTIIEGNIEEKLRERLVDLRFRPVTVEEFDKLTDAEKNDTNTVYIITNSLSYEQDSKTFVTGEQLENRLQDILDKLDIITKEKLDERLDYLNFKRVLSNGKEVDDKQDETVYMVMDSIDVDISSYLPIKEFEKRISDPVETANRPLNPVIGQCYFDTVLKIPLWFNGENWVAADGEPR